MQIKETKRSASFNQRLGVTVASPPLTGNFKVFRVCGIMAVCKQPVPELGSQQAKRARG